MSAISRLCLKHNVNDVTQVKVSKPQYELNGYGLTRSSGGLASDQLRQNVALLKSQVSKNAYVGVLIAAVGAIVATVLAAHYQSGQSL